MSLFDRILAARGLDNKSQAAFLLPDYSVVNDPFLLPDMQKAVDRIVLARERQEHITVYGDYDIDGLTSVALILDAFKQFGFEHVDVFMPNRFIEGYGLTVDAIDKIAASGAQLVITVDCGSQSIKEITRANELGIDVIVTDHHNIAANQPAAIAVINPKRLDHSYPFIDLAGVGVAFKLVQALQIRFNASPETSSGLPFGQEKWLLDLVALGTVCDVVALIGENRTNVFWGLKVLAKQKRLGLKALMAVSGVDPSKLNVRALGFSMGPRMNAAGRLETAQHALDMLVTNNSMDALEKAEYLDNLNIARRLEQAKIVKEAIIQAEKLSDDPVLVVSNKDWNHGIVGIVASKLLEKYKKPVFVLQEMGDESKGSARSYGDFSAATAIKTSEDLITRGGGHELAAGITLPTKNIADFRKRVNELYKSQKLVNQSLLLLPKADALADLSELTEELVNQINQLEPFGNGNSQPVLKSENLTVVNIRRMGADAQHVKLELSDSAGEKMQFLAFSAPEHFFVEPGECLSVWYHLDINEWQGRRLVEGRLLHLEIA
jgi:single-stranded-DNA-specific exonuclease